jgi:hypothetical protein
MIKNIYKSYITTIAGVLFLAADIFYFLKSLSPNVDLIKWVAFIGVILLFINDKYAKKIIDKIINVKI